MDEAAARWDMVEHQIAARGIKDPAILQAMRDVPREQFLPSSQKEFAYQDIPLPIGVSQTISQPFVVALMIEAVGLSGGERVLEIGTGSGYAAAVLARIANEVYTVERISCLAESAASTLSGLHIDNVHVRCDDGTLGWPAKAPFDGIVVSAGGPTVPRSLKHQLAIGGCMVIPVGPVDRQKLIRVTRLTAREYETEELAEVRFVRLIGHEGWECSREE